MATKKPAPVKVKYNRDYAIYLSDDGVIQPGDTLEVDASKVGWYTSNGFSKVAPPKQGTKS